VGDVTATLARVWKSWTSMNVVVFFLTAPLRSFTDKTKSEQVRCDFAYR